MAPATQTEADPEPASGPRSADPPGDRPLSGQALGVQALGTRALLVAAPLVMAALGCRPVSEPVSERPQIGLITKTDANPYFVALRERAILITPSDSRAIVPAIRQARERGVLVIALDSPTDPPGHPVGAQRHNGFLQGFALASRIYYKSVPGSSRQALTRCSWSAPAPDPCQHRRSRALLQPLT